MAVDACVIRPLISVATVLEYEAVLTRTEQLMAMRLTYADVDAFLDGFVARSAIRVKPGHDVERTATVCRVTGLGIIVCRPGDILRRLSWRPSATSPFVSLLH
jgi:hypothetical protein